jgi:hypothetical protein
LPTLLSTFARKASGWATLIVAGVCVLLAVASLPSHPQVALAGPPRPTPHPKPARAPASAPIGATIALALRFGPLWPQAGIPWQDLWTVVQWQDGWGNWHDVEGWQGTPDGIVDGEGRKVWWLSRELLGQGPFRWAIYHARGGELLTISEPFYLPTAPCQLLRVEAWLEPPPVERSSDPPGPAPPP